MNDKHLYLKEGIPSNTMLLTRPKFIFRGLLKNYQDQWRVHSEGKLNGADQH